MNLRIGSNLRWLWPLAAAAALTTLPRETEACGGCFAPPADPTVVTGHRMAFAASKERTVLWDQFSYAGAAEDFSWVLPVRPGAVLEASTDAWFETLEAATQTTISAPQLFCGAGSSSRGCQGCGFSSDDTEANSADGSGGGGGVDVLHEATVGPYETVTLRSEDPDALTTWLEQHGYTVPDSVVPIIDAYVEEKHDFIALRLRPGESITRMTPVRVVTPGGDWLLPLRMVAAGVEDKVAITLFVLGEGRYAMPDLEEVLIEPKDLTWDFSAFDFRQAHNYLDLRDELLAQNKGKVHLTTYAADGEEFAERDFNGTFGSNFTALGTEYFTRAAENEGTFNDCPSAQSLAGAFESSRLVQVEPSGTGEISSAAFRCDTWTDVEAAMIGMHPSKLWLTRLEMDLPLSALTIDCKVERASNQVSVANDLVAVQAINAPCPTATRVPTGAMPGFVASGVVLGALARRRRRPAMRFLMCQRARGGLP